MKKIVFSLAFVLLGLTQVYAVSVPICTADAKLCSDGTYVGRSGPNCEFICPNDGDIPPVVTQQCLDLRNNMFLRSTDAQTGGEVSLLQDFLSPRYFTQEPTGFFGRLTLSAVQKFQRDNNLLSFGYVGPATRAKIKQLTCNTGVLQGTPQIKSLQPSSVMIGDVVAVYGENLNTGNVYVRMNGYRVEVIPSRANSNFVSFVVPDALVPDQIVCVKEPCSLRPIQYITVTPGKYVIEVVNNLGTSNAASLVIKQKDVVNLIPQITSISPQSGAVNDQISIQTQNTSELKSIEIYFGGSLVAYNQKATNVFSVQIPTTITPCGIGAQNLCKIASQSVTPGTYEIAVVTRVNGIVNTSNKILVTVTSSQNTKINLTNLSPQNGTIGTEIAISGTNINIGGDKIYFGNSLVEQVNTSAADTFGVLRFRVPATYTPCGYEENTACRMMAQTVVPGQYEVRVVNSRGVSNALMFTVTSSTSGTPTISGVSGPQALNVGQVGTWTITASSANGGNLSYGVVWGDEGINAAASLAGQSFQQTATFTKSYAQAGTYIPRFTVRNSAGQTATASISVNVGNSTVQTPRVSYLSSVAGGVGSRVTVYGTSVDTGSEYILFDGFRIPTDGAKIAGQVSFIVPQELSQPCIQIKPIDPCPAGALREVIPGSYSVAVGNTNGISNTLTFNVISFGIENPLISKFQIEDVATANSISRALVWTTQFASSCFASGAWNGTQLANGSYSLGFMLQPLTYTLTCVNSQGVSVSRSITGK